VLVPWIYSGTVCSGGGMYVASRGGSIVMFASMLNEPSPPTVARAAEEAELKDAVVG
jgi:hypothetical protein